MVTWPPWWLCWGSANTSASIWLGSATATGQRNIAAALRCYARDATRLLPLLGITGP